MEYILNIIYPWLVGSCFAWITRPRYKYINDSGLMVVAVCVMGSWVVLVVNILTSDKIEKIWKR